MHHACIGFASVPGLSPRTWLLVRPRRLIHASPLLVRGTFPDSPWLLHLDSDSGCCTVGDRIWRMMKSWPKPSTSAGARGGCPVALKRRLNLDNGDLGDLKVECIRVPHR